MQKYYSIFISLAGKKVLVAGGGKVAERKINGLLKKDAVIHVVSPKLTAGLQELAEIGRIIWHEREFQTQDLQDAWLVIAATNDPSTQRVIAESAASIRVFCNVANAPDQGSFITPAVIEHGPIQVAVSTSGSSPVLTKRLKQELIPTVTRHSKGYAVFLNEMRAWIIATEKDEKRRNELLSNLDNTNIEEYFKHGRWRDIEDWTKKNYGDNAVYIVKKHTQSHD
ncbi:MAG: bifunctional precorrin-2 dehydrogenase/sirohydrochlorin ferrochelatase [Dissulfuribacterales bacterium]